MSRQTAYWTVRVRLISGKIEERTYCVLSELEAVKRALARMDVHNHISVRPAKVQTL